MANPKISTIVGKLHKKLSELPPKARRDMHGLLTQLGNAYSRQASIKASADSWIERPPSPQPGPQPKPKPKPSPKPKPRASRKS